MDFPQLIMLSYIQVTISVEEEKIQQIELAHGNSIVWKGKSSPQFKKLVETYFSEYRSNPPLPPLAWENVSTPFMKNALLFLSKIPFGKVITYNELAEQIGHPRAARAVGSACRRNPFPLIVPCHRVLSKGGWGGFTSGMKLKQRLLSLEGHPIR